MVGFQIDPGGKILDRFGSGGAHYSVALDDSVQASSHTPVLLVEAMIPWVLRCWENALEMY